MDGQQEIFKMNRNNDLTHFFNSHGILVTWVDKEEAVRMWRDLFCDGITPEMKMQTPDYNEEFNWHIFSFGLVRAIEGNSADELFEKCCKDKVILFFENSDDAYLCENAAGLTSDTLKLLAQNGGYSYADMYVFHPADGWTYVRTHERSLGPYYYEKANGDLWVAACELQTDKINVSENKEAKST